MKTRSYILLLLLLAPIQLYAGTTGSEQIKAIARVEADKKALMSMKSQVCDLEDEVNYYSDQEPQKKVIADKIYLLKNKIEQIEDKYPLVRLQKKTLLSKKKEQETLQNKIRKKAAEASKTRKGLDPILEECGKLEATLLFGDISKKEEKKIRAKIEAIKRRYDPMMKDNHRQVKVIKSLNGEAYMLMIEIMKLESDLEYMTGITLEEGAAIEPKKK